MMFSAFCPTHDTRVLMTRRNVLGFWNSPDGPVIQWKCNCGHEGFLDRNGTAADCRDAEKGCGAEATAPLTTASTAT